MDVNVTVIHCCIVLLTRFLQATRHARHINSSAVKKITVSMLHGDVMVIKIVRMDLMKMDVVSCWCARWAYNRSLILLMMAIVW